MFMQKVDTLTEDRRDDISAIVPFDATPHSTMQTTHITASSHLHQ